MRALKGIERPIELFRIVAGERETTSLATGRTPYIGRASQRDRIRELWARATSDAAQFLLLRGEPGIGKSRLVELVRDEIARDRADLLFARCAPVTTDTALHPIVELIGSRVGFEGAAPDQRAARLANRLTELGVDPAEALPLLASVLSIPVDPEIWPAPALSPQRARQRTMDILVAMVVALTRRGPVLLVVEDLHWADPSSVELLSQLIGSLRTPGLMALLTARPEFSPTWADAANVTTVELGSLDRAESEIFIRRVARDKPMPPELVWKVRERAAGNPLFLEEITRSILESGALVEREHAWELVGVLSSDVVPDSINASLMARFDRLGEARPLFQLAATLGREFSYDLLAAVAEGSEDTLRRSLDAILKSGLIQLDETSRVHSFKHALIRDAAYDSLLRATRQRHHARIAKVLRAQFPQIVENQPELLAHHLSGAGAHADAAAYWQAAGERAARRSAMKEAVAHLGRALVDLEKLADDATRADRELSILSALGPVQTAVHGWAAPEVAATCTRAIALARQIEARDRMYPPLWALWTNQFVGGRLNEALETANKLLSMGLALGDAKLVNVGRGAVAYTNFYRGAFGEAIRDAEVGLTQCSTDTDAQIAEIFQLSATCTLRITKAGVLWMFGCQDDGVSIVEEMIAYARSLRRVPSLVTALGQAMFFSVDDRNWTRGLALADEVFELSRAEGFAMWNANAGLHRGRCRIGIGQVDLGVAEVLEWGALFRQTGSGILEGSVTSMVSETLHIAGRSEEALAVSVEGERRAESGAVLAMMPEIFRTRGNILRDLDQPDKADDAYRRAVACARKLGARSLELRALTSLLDLRLARGETGGLPAELCHGDGGHGVPKGPPGLRCGVRAAGARSRRTLDRRSTHMAVSRSTAGSLPREAGGGRVADPSSSDLTLHQASDGSVIWWGDADTPEPPPVVAAGKPASVTMAVSPARPGHSITAGVSSRRRAGS